MEPEHNGKVFLAEKTFYVLQDTIVKYLCGKEPACKGKDMSIAVPL